MPGPAESELGCGSTRARLGAATALLVALGVLAFAGATAGAASMLLAPDAVGCPEVICEEPPLLAESRTPPVLERWFSSDGLSVAYPLRQWRAVEALDDSLELAFDAGGTLHLEVFPAASSRTAFDTRIADLGSRYVELSAQGTSREILGASVAGERAVAGAFCATAPGSPQDVGKRVDIVEVVAVRSGMAVEVRVISDGCGGDARNSSLLGYADSVLNSIRWPVGGVAFQAAPATGALEPAELAEAYNIDPLQVRGFSGEGQTIAVVAWAPIPTDDIDQFDREFGIEASGPIESRGPTPDGEVVQFGALEANLDLQVLRAVAPEARVIAYYSGPTMGDLVTTIERIVSDGEADIVSISGGTCDTAAFASGRAALRSGVRMRGERALAQAVQKGITVFVASGDTGAYACQQGERSDHRVTTKWPTDSVYVVSVGGTLRRGAGVRSVESGWQDVLSFAGSGGGANPIDARPSWQRAVGLPPRPSRRLVPDVAAAASPESGYAIVHDGRQITVGGTSGAAPLWAALFSLIEEYVASAGGAEIGFAAPVLYDVARSRAGTSAFRDVVGGGNRLDAAGDGWDAATGLGTPNAWELAQALVGRRGRATR